MEVSGLVRRQYYYGDGWWYSTTAYIIKWSILAALIVGFFIFFIGGYMHARRRMARGEPPLRYHRWMVPKRTRYAFAHAHPEHAHLFPGYRVYMDRQRYYGYPPANGQAYYMGHYGPPPPAYGEPEYVPAYTPAGANKTDPNQTYAAPPGPPPPGPSQPEPAAVAGGR